MVRGGDEGVVASSQETSVGGNGRSVRARLMRTGHTRSRGALTSVRFSHYFITPYTESFFCFEYYSTRAMTYNDNYYTCLTIIPPYYYSHNAARDRLGVTLARYM